MDDLKRAAIGLLLMLLLLGFSWGLLKGQLVALHTSPGKLAKLTARYLVGAARVTFRLVRWPLSYVGLAGRQLRRLPFKTTFTDRGRARSVGFED